MERDVARSDEAFLEIDEPVATPDVPPDDPSYIPSPSVPAGDDAFLEVSDGVEPAARTARGLTEDDLRTVTALAEDARPLLAALWPMEPDLAARMPTPGALSARLEHARTAVNQATRRGAEWRARAELAGAALSRRLGVLGGPSDPAALALAAAGELRAWHLAALTVQARSEADAAGRLYAAEVRRLDAEARQRGLGAADVRALCATLGLEAVVGDAGWTACDALPGAPRTRDAAAEALVTAQAQGVAALRDGAVRAWLGANRAPDDLVAAAVEAEGLAGDRSTAALGLWTMAWALGREGVLVDGQEAGAPEALLAHMRSARLHDSQVEAAAPVLARWYRRRGNLPVAAACEALARGEAHGAARLRWALGDPLRLGGRAVHDPAGLAREVVTREAARAAALAAWRDGALGAWLAALPMAKRDAAWAEEISEAARATGGDGADETPFWRGVYRRAPRAALRVPVTGGVARFGTSAELVVTARAAAAWEPLKSLLRTGELLAWLEVAAPGIELDGALRGVDGDEDLALNTALWTVGHTGLVLPWGRGGVAVAAPADVVSAWQRSPAVLESPAARACVGRWLGRFHGDARAGGVTLGRALGALASPSGGMPAGHAGLLLALLCGLDALPADPLRPGGGRTFRGWHRVDRTPPEGTDREAAWEPLRMYLDTGVALVWAARHAPALGALLAARIDGAVEPAAVLRQMAAAGVPVVSSPLAGEIDAARGESEREAARLATAHAEARLATARTEAARALARIEAEREAAKLMATREAARAEAEQEIAELTARREEARRATEQEIARLAAEREAARRTAGEAEARAAADAELARWTAAQAATAEDASRRAAARAAASRRAAARAVEDEATREARWAAERAAAEGEVARLSEARVAAERVAEALAGAGAPGPGADDGALEPVAPEAVFGAEALRATEAEDPGAEAWAWGDRREIVADRLVEAAEAGGAARARWMAGVDAWARALPNHPWQDLATRMEVLDVAFRPGFEVAVTTRLETRTQGAARPPWREDRLVPGPPDMDREGTDGGALPGVDPWAVALPDADTYGPWSAAYLLDVAPVRRGCAGCEGTGRAACGACGGAGTVPCRRCDATGRERCPRCVGAGAVLGANGPERCTVCDGRRDVRCGACVAGRARCRGCANSGRVACEDCGGPGVVVERPSVAQSFAAVAAFGVVAPGLPERVREAVRAAAAEGRPVVHVEGAELDPYALAREIPHPELGSFAAQLLADEAGRGRDGARATRQRLLVRRYPAWRVCYRVETTAYELWVHGVRMAVHAEDSPIERYIGGLVTAAREALAAGDLGVATDRLLDLVQIDAEHAEGRALAGALGEAVRAMALRGELFAAREAAARAAAVAWPECLAPLVEAERVLARRLNAPTAWALVEEAARALDRGRLDRAAEKLTALAAAAPDHAEGQALAATLAGKLRALEASEPAAAEALAAAVGRVPWGGCGDVAGEVQRRGMGDARRRMVRRWAPVAAGVAAVGAVVAVLLGR